MNTEEKLKQEIKKKSKLELLKEITHLHKQLWIVSERCDKNFELAEEGYQLGFKEGQNSIKGKKSWIYYDDEIQKNVWREIERWKKDGRQWSGTYFTLSIYRLVAKLLEDERSEGKAEQKQNGYYTCPCGKRYTAKVRRCGCGLLFENFHQTYVPKKKVIKK